MAQHPEPKSLLSRPARWLALLLEEALVLFALAVAAAFAWDDLWLAWRGQQPWAVCGLFSLLPWSLIPVTGAAMMVVGVLLALGKRKTLGIALFIA